MGAEELNNVDLESLQKRRTKNEQRTNNEWLYSGSTVGLQWVYSGSTVGLQRTKDEGMMNNERRKSEGKLKLRQ